MRPFPVDTKISHELIYRIFPLVSPRSAIGARISASLACGSGSLRRVVWISKRAIAVPTAEVRAGGAQHVVELRWRGRGHARSPVPLGYVRARRGRAGFSRRMLLALEMQAATGQAQLAGVGSALDPYQGLLGNAAEAQSRLRLNLRVGLTAAQVNRRRSHLMGLTRPLVRQR